MPFNTRTETKNDFFLFSNPIINPSLIFKIYNEYHVVKSSP